MTESKTTAVRIVNARLVDNDHPVDVTVVNGVVTSVSPSDDHSSTGNVSNVSDVGNGDAGVASTDTAIGSTPIDTVDADGRWIIPGLWDGHTHFTQWAATFGRLDLLAATSASEAMTMLRDYLDARRTSAEGLDPNAFVVGMRFRHSLWSDAEQPTLVAIDAVSGNQPVALSSADMHCGWVNSAAARRLGVHVGSNGLVGELEWFDAYCRLDDATGNEQLRMIDAAERDAAGKGVVGICDYEMADTISQWTARFAAGLDRLRVRAGVYPGRIEQAVADGWRGGDEIPGSHGLAHATTLKLISDGSLNTRSAYCSQPYSNISPETRGVLSYSPEAIEHYMTVARDNGFDVACHAIGDAANAVVLDAFARTGAHGAIEHAQQLQPNDVTRFAGLGLTASVQPQHAVDDRDVVSRYWAGMDAIPFPYRTLHNAGVPFRFGSDAPVAVLDPWVAMAAAVYRTDDDRDAYQPEQRLDLRTALASSTFGQGIAPHAGMPADLVLLDRNPLAMSSPAELRSMPVAATMCAARWTHFTL
ncbi:amidohydrolase [Bifidobacterium tissieri]|uniref:Amidohydrolase n=1 Tax=Bifidobacterium tissieri TaxID=1630162 RepID=A0A5M9ZRL2_9BIFI|nr:amidohydrolase [Bifidobacterium tissieri]KAA8829953.1 amidohydrolase [Bifidobacterium tissieri]KAA8830600.1 amidohydrolase [Bifidobacterium tissieri]